MALDRNPQVVRGEFPVAVSVMERRHRVAAGEQVGKSGAHALGLGPAEDTGNALPIGKLDSVLASMERNTHISFARAQAFNNNLQIGCRRANRDKRHGRCGPAARKALVIRAVFLNPWPPFDAVRPHSRDPANGLSKVRPGFPRAERLIQPTTLRGCRLGPWHCLTQALCGHPGTGCPMRLLQHVNPRY